jgi:hypothetical protein
MLLQLSGGFNLNSYLNVIELINNTFLDRHVNLSHLKWPLQKESVIGLRHTVQQFDFLQFVVKCAPTNTPGDILAGCPILTTRLIIDQIL